MILIYILLYICMIILMQIYKGGKQDEGKMGNLQ